jgi:VanZ family protein
MGSDVKLHQSSCPLVRRLCLAAAVVLIFQLFYLGARPEAAGLIPAPWDKLAHFAVYSALTVLLWIGTEGRMPLAMVAVVAAVGALDELHQSGLPGRVGDVWDFLADVCAGTGTAFALLLLYGAGRPRRAR